MRITEFTIGCSHTLNLGNFESLRIEASVTCELPEGEETADVVAKANAELRGLLEETFKAQRRKRGE